MTDDTLHVWGYASGCPACDKLKALLDAMKVPYKFYPIARDSTERVALKDAGFDTVPQVFCNNRQALGGYQELLKAARAGVTLYSGYMASEGS